MAHGAIRNISIHAPLVGSDSGTSLIIRPASYFNPRSPRGERRIDTHDVFGDLLISIHAPLAGSDKYIVIHYTGSEDFNPRSPRGERPASRAESYLSE